MKSSLPVEYCDVAYALGSIGGRWKILIIWRLLEGRIRFSDLRRKLAGITESVLIVQLKELERDGLVKRISYDIVPPRVEYELTPIGLSLRPAIETLNAWGGTLRYRNQRLR